MSGLERIVARAVARRVARIAAAAERIDGVAVERRPDGVRLTGRALRWRAVVDEGVRDLVQALRP